MTIFGVDASHHQGVIQWDRMVRDGVRFAGLKATEGSEFEDSQFERNLMECRRLGVIAFAYHYQRATVSPLAQVDQICDVVPRDCPVVLDVERNSGHVGMTREIVAQLRRRGYRVPLLYLPRWYWYEIGSPSLTGLPPLWSSRYPNMTQLPLTRIYASINGDQSTFWSGYGNLPVEVLQFTSSAIVGGRQPIDGNAYRGSASALRTLLYGDDTPDPTEDNDMTPEQNRMLTELHTLLRKGNPKPGVRQTAGEYAKYLVEILTRGRRQDAQITTLVRAVAAATGPDGLTEEDIRRVFREELAAVSDIIDVDTDDEAGAADPASES